MPLAGLGKVTPRHPGQEIWIFSQRIDDHRYRKMSVFLRDAADWLLADERFMNTKRTLL